MSVEDEDTSLCYRVWVVKLQVSEEGGGNKDINQERKFTKNYTRKNGRKKKVEEKSNLEQKDTYRIWNKTKTTEKKM